MYHGVVTMLQLLEQNMQFEPKCDVGNQSAFIVFGHTHLPNLYREIFIRTKFAFTRKLTHNFIYLPIKFVLIERQTILTLRNVRIKFVQNRTNKSATVRTNRQLFELICNYSNKSTTILTKLTSVQTSRYSFEQIGNYSNKSSINM
jgi:hypothetical protein